MIPTPFIEAFYNVTPKTTEFSSLVAEFPKIFTEKPLTPINFTMLNEKKMNELHQNSTNSFYQKNLLNFSQKRSEILPKTEKFCTQSIATKLALKKSILYEILANKEKNDFFANFLKNDEKPEDKIWLFFKNEQNDDSLRGPFTTEDMQTKFENNELNPDFRIKKKLDEDFSWLWQLMDLYLKEKISKSFNSGENVKNIVSIYKNKTENLKIKNLLEQFIR